MTGDVREALEVYLLAKLAALTTRDGLPANFGLVTRELIHLGDLKTSQLPACFLQMEEPEVVPHLSHVVEVTLPGRIVIGFAATATLPASVANAYRVTLEQALMADVHLGGLVDFVILRGTLMPGLWPEVGLLALGVLFSCTYEYNATLPPLVV